MRIDTSRYQVYVAFHFIGRSKRICNFLGPRYTFESQAHVATHVLSKLKDIYSLPGLSYIFGS